MPTQEEKKQLEKWVRSIAKEEGLDQHNEDILVATIWCESSFDPHAKNTNNNGTVDYGLCQFNDYWYKDLITPYEAEYNVEKAVRLMCRKFKEGRANDWCCYRFGGYQKFMPQKPDKALWDKLIEALKKMLKGR